MAKVITLSRTFPAYHPKAGQPTYFVEQVLNSLGINYRNTDYYDNLILWNAGKIYEGKLDSSQILSLSSDLAFNSVFGKDVASEKLHTIRAKTVNKKTKEVYSRWKQGDKASLRVWSGKPYRSPQIIIAPDVEIKQVGDFLIKKCQKYDNLLEMWISETWIDIDKKYKYPHTVAMPMSIIPDVAKNDGLQTNDLLDWFKYPKPFEGQILCWKEVDYLS